MSYPASYHIILYHIIYYWLTV